MKRNLKIFTGLVGLIYLLNPGAGLFELIPDTLPVIGNLDEAAAVFLVINAYRAIKEKKADTEKLS